MSEHIIIIGAGLVGSSAALALAQAGFAVTLLDASPDSEIILNHNEPDLRCSALVPKTILFLKKLGIWPKILNHRAGVFRSMQIWNESSIENNLLLTAHETGLPELGFIVENNAIQFFLNEALRETNCEIIRSIETTKIEIQNDNVTLHYNDKSSITGNLLVAADGSNSWVRNHLQLSITKHDYAQKAIVTFVTHEKPHQNNARQVFLKAGPLAFLPLYENNLSSIVWTVGTDEAEELLNESADVFNKKLSQYMNLGTITESGKRAAFPLQRQHAKEYVKSRVALIGDAAHSVHPLAGQGLNLGFADVQNLIEIIQEAKQKHRDFGALDSLRKYERARKFKNGKMMLAIEFCQRGFCISQGFGIVNHNPLFKKWIVDQASFP